MALETLQEPTVAELGYVGAFQQTPPAGVREPFELSLTEAPIHVLKSQLDAQTTEYHVVFEHKPLHGQALLQFLLAAAPDRNGSSYGVLADWVLPDQITNPGRDEGRNNKLLSDHEKALGQHWKDFESSRHLYMQALDDENYMTFNPTDNDVMRIKFLEHDEIDGLFRQAALEFDFHEGRRVYGSEELPSFVETIAGYMQQDGLVTDRDAKRMGEGKIRKIAAQIYRKHGEQYARRYFNELDETQQAVAVETYKDIHYRAVSLDDGREAFIGNRHTIPVSDLIQAYQQRRSVPIKGTEKDIDFAYITVPSGYRKAVFLDTIRDGVRKTAIQPVLSWQTTQTPDGAERQLIVDNYDVDLTNPNKRVHPNVIGGLLCVAYLSPEFRENDHLWPRTMRIPGQDRGQELGAAQVPVLALMRRNQLLEVPLIDSLEEFAA